MTTFADRLRRKAEELEDKWIFGDLFEREIRKFIEEENEKVLAQQRAQKEINEILEKTPGDPDYEDFFKVV